MSTSRCRKQMGTYFLRAKTGVVLLLVLLINGNGRSGRKARVEGTRQQALKRSFGGRYRLCHVADL